jgi:hypothetical protein
LGLREDEVTGEWRKLHNEELNDLYCSPNIVRGIKSRRMSLAFTFCSLNGKHQSEAVQCSDRETKHLYGRHGSHFPDVATRSAKLPALLALNCAHDL